MKDHNRDQLITKDHSYFSGPPPHIKALEDCPLQDWDCQHIENWGKCNKGEKEKCSRE
jgi:hypothetical protein